MRNNNLPPAGNGYWLGVIWLTAIVGAVILNAVGF